MADRTQARVAALTAVVVAAGVLLAGCGITDADQAPSPTHSSVGHTTRKTGGKSG